MKWLALVTLRVDMVASSSALLRTSPASLVFRFVAITVVLGLAYSVVKHPLVHDSPYLPSSRVDAFPVGFDACRTIRGLLECPTTTSPCPRSREPVEEIIIRGI